MTWLWMFAPLAIAAGGWAVWALYERWRDRRDVWPDWSTVYRHCLRCGCALPVRETAADEYGVVITLIPPIAVACEQTRIYGLLCGRDCAAAWSTQHMAIHHPDRKDHP